MNSKHSVPGIQSPGTKHIRTLPGTYFEWFTNYKNTQLQNAILNAMPNTPEGCELG